MEPLAMNMVIDSRGNPNAVAPVSIAISLKRIADAVEGNPRQLGLVEAIAEAISRGIYQGRQG